MSPEDAGRAVAEHATSKIRTADDLASVVSLGFLRISPVRRSRKYFG
jgi:DNA mismatch repair ATPase MutL